MNRLLILRQKSGELIGIGTEHIVTVKAATGGGSVIFMAGGVAGQLWEVTHEPKQLEAIMNAPLRTVEYKPDF